MTVYVELVLFNNFAVDLMLIIATLSFLRRKLRWWRVLLSAIFGSIVATVYPLCPDFVEIIIKIVLAPIMTLLFDSLSTSNARGQKCKSSSTREESEVHNKFLTKEKKSEFAQSFKGYLKRLALFCLFTYMLGGIDFAISYAFDIDISSYWQFGVTAVSVTILMLAVRLFVLKMSKCARKICDADVRLGSSLAKLKSLCDSGNTLTDSLSGLPVVILSNEAESRLLVDENAIEGYIAVRTVAGENSMPIVRLDSVEVKGKTYSAYGALSRQDFDGVEIILQNTMF